MIENAVRKDYVDVLKSIGIILVILGHINHANDYVKEWIYSFHMPLFFFATGLTLRVQEINIPYLKRKIQTLIVPFFVWGFLYAGFSLKNLACLGYGSYSSIIKAGSLSSLWFLPVFFVSTIFAQFILKNKFALVVIISGCLLSLSIFLPIISFGYLWGGDIAILAAFFVIVGFYFEKKWLVKSKRCLAFLMLSFFVLTFSFLLNPINEDGYVLMATRRVGNWLCFLFTATVGCFFCYYFARLIEVNRKMLPFITYVGRNTLIIFICHKPIIDIVTKLDCGFPWYVELPLSCILVLLLSCVFVYLTNLFVPGLVGKTK